MQKVWGPPASFAPFRAQRGGFAETDSTGFVRRKLTMHGCRDSEAEVGVNVTSLDGHTRRRHGFLPPPGSRHHRCACCIRYLTAQKQAWTLSIPDTVACFCWENLEKKSSPSFPNRDNEVKKLEDKAATLTGRDDSHCRTIAKLRRDDAEHTLMNPGG